MQNSVLTPAYRAWTSASRAYRDSNCPGAYLLERTLPEPPTNESQVLGDLVHQALANSSNTAVLNSLSAKQRDLFDSCRAIEKKLVLDWFGPDAPAYQVFREERKFIRFRLPNGAIVEHSGQADTYYLCGAKGLVIDYKSLAGEVQDVSANEQIRDLIVLWKGWINQELKQPLVECAGTIVQPYVTHSPRLVVYKEPEMDQAAKEMMLRVRNSHDPQSKRIAGEHCKFCKAAYWGKCLEHQQWASATLPTFRDITSMAVEQWSPEQRTIFMDRYAIAEQWLKDTKKALEAGAIADPSFVPGYAMVDGTVKTPITDLQELINRIVAHGGTAQDLLIEAGDIAKGSLETYFKRLIKSKIKGSVAQNKAYEDLLKGIVTPKANKPTLKKI